MHFIYSDESDESSGNSDEGSGESEESSGEEERAEECNEDGEGLTESYNNDNNAESDGAYKCFLNDSFYSFYV